MQRHEIEAPQRRMLLELLASERAGEDALVVGNHFGRDDIAASLCALELAEWVGPDEAVLTGLGRHVAESLARRLLSSDDDTMLAFS